MASPREVLSEAYKDASDLLNKESVRVLNPDHEPLGFIQDVDENLESLFQAMEDYIVLRHSN